MYPSVRVPLAGDLSVYFAHPTPKGETVALGWDVPSDEDCYMLYSGKTFLAKRGSEYLSPGVSSLPVLNK